MTLLVPLIYIFDLKPELGNELETLLQNYLKDVKRRYQFQSEAKESLTFTRVFQLEFDIHYIANINNVQFTIMLGSS